MQGAGEQMQELLLPPQQQQQETVGIWGLTGIKSYEKSRVGAASAGY